MNKKNIDIKKTLLDNGIIIVLLLLVLITGITKDNLQKMKLNDSKLYEKYATTTESRVFQVKKIVK